MRPSRPSVMPARMKTTNAQPCKFDRSRVIRRGIMTMRARVIWLARVSMVSLAARRRLRGLQGSIRWFGGLALPRLLRHRDAPPGLHRPAGPVEFNLVAEGAGHADRSDGVLEDH